MAPRLSPVSTSARPSLGWTYTTLSVFQYIARSCRLSRYEYKSRRAPSVTYAPMASFVWRKLGISSSTEKAKIPRTRHRWRTPGSPLRYLEWPGTCRVCAGPWSSWISSCYSFPSVCTTWNSDKVLPDRVSPRYFLWPLCLEGSPRSRRNCRCSDPHPPGLKPSPDIRSPPSSISKTFLCTRQRDRPHPSADRIVWRCISTPR